MAEAGLMLLQELRRRGWAVKVDGDHLMVKPPKPDVIEEARPLLDELRQRKAEVLAALREVEQPATEERPAPAPAPAVGRPTWHLAPIPPERQVAEARRRLDDWGWCGILARKLGDDAVLILATDPAKVPADLARCWPVLTLLEVADLLQAGIEAAEAAYVERLAALGGEAHA